MRLACTAQRTWMIANKKSTGDEGVIDSLPTQAPSGWPRPHTPATIRSGPTSCPRHPHQGSGGRAWGPGVAPGAVPRGRGCFVHSQACRTMPRFNNWFPAGFFPCCSWAIRTIHLCPLLVNPQQLSAGHDGWMTIHRWHK